MIIWGTKHVESKLGRTADFCSMCRSVQPHSVKKLRSVGHIYYIPLGSGQVLGHFETCETCGHTSDVDPTIFNGLAKKRSKDDVRVLVASCFPGIGQYYAERLELEEQLKKSPESIDPEVREELIREVFLNVSPEVEDRYSSTKLDWRCGASGALSIVIPSLMLTLGQKFFEEPLYSETITPAAGWVFVLGMLVTVGFATQVNRRFMREVIVPKVARTMSPLRPNEAELDTMLERFKAADMKVGKKLKAADICRAIDPALARSIG